MILYCGVQCYHWENLYKETVLTTAWGLSFSVVLLSSTVSNVVDICCLCLDNTVFSSSGKQHAILLRGTILYPTGNSVCRTVH